MSILPDASDMPLYSPGAMSDVQYEYWPSHFPGKSYSAVSEMSISYYYSYISDDTDESEVEPWKLKLPIHGRIALRRAMKRGEDPFDVQREQRSRFVHECSDKHGPYKDVAVSFQDVDYGAPHQPRSEMARKIDGEPVSPGSVPKVHQMNIQEYSEAFGIDWQDLKEWMIVDEGGNEEQQVEQQIHPSELLENYYYARQLSNPSAEGWFDVNPFEGCPESV